MAGVAVRIDVRGVPRLREWIRRLDPADALPLIAAAGESVTRALLAEGGPAPDGTPWKPWRAGYEGGQGILHRSGALRDSIESGADRDEAWWGSNLVYARIHQEGGVVTPKRSGGLLSWVGGGGERVFARRVTIPARPFLGFGPRIEDAIEGAVETWWRRSLPA